MCRKSFFLMIFFVFSATVRAEESDAQIVQSILDKCGMSGVTVNDVAVFEEERITSLNLSNKEISRDGITFIPPEIGRLTSLREFICTDNSIDSIPREIGNCSNLTKLNLASNRILIVPAEIGKLSNLRILDLRHNAISEFTPEIGDCSNLEFLWLWGNKLTELDPAITRLRKLKELYLTENRLTTLPVGIIGMRLKYIDISGNKLCALSSILDAWAKKIDAEYRQMQKCL